jgi:hypothetical protein
MSMFNKKIDKIDIQATGRASYIVPIADVLNATVGADWEQKLALLNASLAAHGIEISGVGHDIARECLSKVPIALISECPDGGPINIRTTIRVKVASENRAPFESLAHVQVETVDFRVWALQPLESPNSQVAYAVAEFARVAGLLTATAKQCDHIPHAV